MFNLGNGDDDVLTHRGRTLEEIEKFDNPLSESEDDEDGKLEGNNTSFLPLWIASFEVNLINLQLIP